jgi:hypothetical protein
MRSLSAILKVALIFAAGEQPENHHERFVDTEIQNSGKSFEPARTVVRMVVNCLLNGHSWISVLSSYHRKETVQLPILDNAWGLPQSDSVLQSNLQRVVPFMALAGGYHAAG